MKAHRRPLAAAVMAVALVLGLAAPAPASASAGGPYPFEPAGGTLSTAIGGIYLGPNAVTPPPGVCEDKTVTLALRTSADAAPAGADRWSTSGGFTTFFRLGAPPSGPWYQADLTFGGNGQVVGAGSPHAVTGTVAVQMRVYEIPSPATTCAKTTLRCIATGRFVITTGTYVGSFPSAVPGGTLAFDATTGTAGGINLATASCVAPYVSLNGTVASLMGLTFQVA